MSFDQVSEFNTTFEVVMRDKPNVRVPEARLRFRLIKEEFGELLEAVEDCDIVEIADALGDIKYVVVGAALVFGIADEAMVMFHEIVSELLTDADLETNPLLIQEGHDIMLKDIREYILTQDIDSLIEALGSVLALVYFTADHYQIDLDAVVDAIHTSNMTKLGEDGKPIFREGDRKVMKGPGYKTPTADIEALLFGTTNAASV